VIKIKDQPIPLYPATTAILKVRIMKYIWLDCDPGHDDAMAIILACYHPESSLIGISTVAGNQSVDKTTANAMAILSAIGRSDVIVLKGQGSALLNPMPFCAEIHGETGLDGLDGKPIFPHVEEQKTPGFWLENMKNAIANSYFQTGDPINLVCTGSLTNAALLLTLFPEIKQYIRISLMGGAMGIGNTGPVSEFNIENDPESAHIVFESGVDLTMIPLEVTHTVLVTPEILDTIGNSTEFRKKISELLTFFKESYLNYFGFENPPLHDPLAVFHALSSEAFLSKIMRVDIECASQLSRGQTICDIYDKSKKVKNCTVAMSVNVESFWEVMLEALDGADKTVLFSKKI